MEGWPILIVILFMWQPCTVVLVKLEETYMTIQPVASTNWRCEQVADAKKYGRINCAAWCHVAQCEGFNFDEDMCTICSRCNEFSSSPQQVLTSETTFGKWLRTQTVLKTNQRTAHRTLVFNV